MAMKVGDRTKYIFAEALKDMLKTKDLSEVRISDLCKKCGTDRKTFYYHFEDKYDLMAWILAGYYEPVIIKEKDFTDFKKGLQEGHQIVIEELSFFKRASADEHFGTMLDYLLKYTVEMLLPLAQAQLGGKQPDELQLFSLRLYAYGALHMSREWILGDCKIPIEEYVKKLLWSLPAWMKG